MTHVQRGSVPAIMQGADVLLRARTGTGKTLAYLVPIAQYLADRPERIPREQGTHALIVVPTRELAVQGSGAKEGDRRGRVYRYIL